AVDGDAWRDREWPRARVARAAPDDWVGCLFSSWKTRVALIQPTCWGGATIMRRMRISLVIALVTLTVIAASQAVTGQTAGGDKALIMAVDQSEAKTFDPARGFEFMSFLVDLNTYEPLVAQKS